MNYYYSKSVSSSFDETIQRVTDKLKSEGFGIVSEIRMHDKFKEKLNVDFKRYTILGACNPSFALKALQIEDKIGTMLPCNIIVIDQGNGKTELAAINPLATMSAVQNTELNNVAEKVAHTLKAIIEQI
jgi:uncharacterized protein (DUF302 family)